MDRRKLGARRAPLVSRQGVPLAVRTAGANVRDHRQILPAAGLDRPRVGGNPGRPKEGPGALYAGRGCDSGPTRLVLRWLRIEPRIARRRTGRGLGKVRRVAERTISWVNGRRRMGVRHDRPGVIRDAFTTLAASVVCFRILRHDAV